MMQQVLVPGGGTGTATSFPMKAQDSQLQVQEQQMMAEMPLNFDNTNYSLQAVV